MENHSFPAPGLDKRSGAAAASSVRPVKVEPPEEGARGTREVTLTASEAAIIEAQRPGAGNVAHAMRNALALVAAQRRR